MDGRRRTAAAAARVFEDFDPAVEWKVAGEEQDVVEITLPEFRKDQVRVQVDGHGVLRATGERPTRGGRWARFVKDLRLPNYCDADGVRARFEGDKIIITLPIAAATPSQTSHSPTPSPTPQPPPSPPPAPVPTYSEAARPPRLLPPPSPIPRYSAPTTRRPPPPPPPSPPPPTYPEPPPRRPSSPLAPPPQRSYPEPPPRRQPPHGHGVGRSLTHRRGRRQSPSDVALFLLSKKRKHVGRETTGLRRPRRVFNATRSRCSMLGSVVLTLDLLKQITNDFSDDQDHLLGEGAFGKVYKGVLPNGDTIAVKRFASTITGLQDDQYENEAQRLMGLKHPNIVQLVGYCSESETKLVLHNGTYIRAKEPERLLCLEYMPEGSLRDHLSDKDKNSKLEWDTRYRIIEGICYALHYLHEEWQATPIIHMDLKPANILLDDNMVPKIADFGLSRLFGESQTRTYTRSCKGTRGYMAPEYVDQGVITKMFDIFSLGVIIIEIITGLKDYPIDETEITSQQYIDRVLNDWRDRLTKAQGSTSQDIDYQQIEKCIKIGLLCVKVDRMKRPTIKDIIKMLEISEEAYQIEREVKSPPNYSFICPKANQYLELIAEKKSRHSV